MGTLHVDSYLLFILTLRTQVFNRQWVNFTDLCAYWTDGSSTRFAIWWESMMNTQNIVLAVILAVVIVKMVFPHSANNDDFV